MAAVMLRRITWSIAIFDALLLAITLAAVYFMRFGTDDVLFLNSEDSGLLRFALTPWQQALFMFAIWVLVLAANKSRDYRILGSDSQEYKRVAMSGLLVPVFFAFAALLFKVDIPRLYIASSIALGTVVLLANRWAWRQWLMLQRTRGQYVSKVALLGPMSQIESLAQKMLKTSTDGFQPAVLIPDSEAGHWATVGNSLKLPVADFSDNFPAVLSRHGCKALMVVGSQIVSDSVVKQIAWRLEGTGIDLVVASPLKDFGTHRLEVRPVAGTPVFVIQVPKFQGWKHLVKDAFDILTGAVAFVVTMPILLVFGFLVWAHDRGPVFFRQRRVGQNGREFFMLKLRSMSVGAEKLHGQMLLEANTSPNAIMYKNPDDPRVTPIGKFIRRWSIDELPQFINVLRGEMSMVGPRPPMPSEVAGYEDDAFRRLLVKPGITGLWQVSGRNELTWEETVALDLNYVENWSVIGDILLLMKTISTVVSSPRISNRQKV
jgi:exopolysaccharide biosynthesis polyprenyl glycosylphosphotransferase